MQYDTEFLEYNFQFVYYSFIFYIAKLSVAQTKTSSGRVSSKLLVVGRKWW